MNNCLKCFVLYHMQYYMKDGSVRFFLNWLDDVLKQFTIVGSLKEQQAQQHKK